MPTFTLDSLVKSYPAYDYETIKNDILGKRYDLSLLFVGPSKAKALNEAYRGKDYVPNVLSFPLDEKHGEMFICPSVAAREAKHFNLSKDGYIVYLFVHGCLHLTGLDHGDAMDAAEARYRRKYAIV